MIRYSKRKLKLIPLVFFVLILTLTVGFSAFNRNLMLRDIGAQIRIVQDIRITGIIPSGSTNDGYTISEDYNVKNILPSFTLPNANSTVTYTVEVTNIGNARMEILNITGLPSNLHYTISGYNLDELICDDNNSNKCSLGAVKTFTITIGYVNNGFDSSNTTYNVNLLFDFEVYDYYDLTINSDQTDSNVTLTTTEGTYTGTGSVSHRVKVGSVANYTVSKTLYYTVNESYTMGEDNHTINVTMELLKYTITFNANGGSVNTPSKRVVYNTAIGELPVPTKANGIFIGWFSDTPSQNDSSVSYKDRPLRYYADSYGDLYNAFNYDDNSLYNHYLDHGIGEGRKILQYVSTDVLPTNNDITLYAGWVYKWEKFDKVKTWDEVLTLSNAESGRINAGSYFAFKERAKLAEIANVDDQKLHFTEGRTSSILNPLPDHDVYVFAANSDSIRSGQTGDNVVEHFCVIKSSRVTLWAYITCDIYHVTNIRYVQGNTSYGYLYNSNLATYPSDNELGDNWYVLQ